jgi:uncharacterized protein
MRYSITTTGLFVLASVVLGQSQPAAPEFSYPRIKEHGKVVRFPDAAEQPRSGSKICVDATAGGPPDEVNPAIEKVARYVNIYAGAGRRPADVRITVILHGKATTSCYSDEAYARKFEVAKNPNLPLIAELKGAGVEFLVCGQALAHNGGPQQDVAGIVRVAVSALTVNVNRQADGYAYVPLH